MNSMITEESRRVAMGKVPDLVGDHSLRQLTYQTKTGGRVDERPVIVDYESGSTGRVLRIMKWGDDYVPGHESKKGCCLRFEVKVIKPGRRSTHHEDDVVIWSQTLNDVLNHAPIMEALYKYGIHAKELRASLIRDGFPDQAASF